VAMAMGYAFCGGMRVIWGSSFWASCSVFGSAMIGPCRMCVLG